MPHRALIALLSILLLAGHAAAQFDTRQHEDIVVIKAGEIITGTGDVIENGFVVIIDGVIAAVDRAVEYPRTARVIDASNETIMPGLIHSRTRHGLPNYSRSGSRSHLKAADEVYLELIDFEELLRHGFTAVNFIPSGSGLPGQSAVYRTAGPDAHRQLREVGYLRITMSSPGRDKPTLRTALRNAQRAIEQREKAREEWEKKQAERAEKEAEDQPQPEGDNDNGENGENAATRPRRQGRRGDQNNHDNNDKDEPTQFKPPDIDPPLRPLVDLIERKEGVAALIELSGGSDLIHAFDVIDRYDDLPVMFYLQPGQGSFKYIVEDLGKREALVVTGPDLARLPNTVVRYNLVADLFRAGAEVAILPSGSLPHMRSMLADLVRSGLPVDDAIRAITVNPARVVGVDDRLGTLEADKHADIVFLDSHPLDGLSKVTRTMIRGEIVWTSGDDS